MREKEEIIASLDWLRKQSNEITKNIKQTELELADCLSEFKVGQRVIMSYARKETEYEISRVDLYWGYQVRYMGRKVLKSGSLHKSETTLYGEIRAKPEES